MMMCHLIKFGCKKISSSADMVETVIFERFRRYRADTIRHMVKISSGQTFTNILNLPCDRVLEHSNPILPHDMTIWLMMLYYQTKFGCKATSSLADTSEDTTEIVVF